MTKAEILNKIKELRLHNAQILDAVEKEARKASKVEELTMQVNNAEITELEKDLVVAEKAPKMSVGENRSAKGFNLLTAVKDFAENRSANEATIAMNELGRKSFNESGLESRGHIIIPAEYRADIIAGTDANGKLAIATDKFDLIGGLRANNILFQAGAQLLPNLVGNVSIPVYGLSSVAWSATENANAADGASTFSELTMSPKRITGYIDISKQFLQQTSPAAAQLLQDDLIAAVNGLLESTAFGIVSGSTAKPAGMFYNVTYTSTGTTDFSKLVALESAVDTSNALRGKLAYVTTPAMKGKLKTTPRTATYGNFMIMEGAEANGYPVYTSSLVNAGKVAFGNWSDFVVGQWGGLDLLIDPYSVSLAGKVRIVINAYFDMIKRRTASFAYGNLT